MSNITPLFNDFWVIKDNDNIVATIHKEDTQYRFQYLNGEIFIHEYATLESMFGVIPSYKSVDHTKRNIYGYPTDCAPYNITYEVQSKLPLYSKTDDSKNMYCAGYYAILKNGIWQTAFCPRALFLKSIKYIGPYKTEDEAEIAAEDMQFNAFC